MALYLKQQLKVFYPSLQKKKKKKKRRISWLWHKTVKYYCHYSQIHSELEWEYLLGCVKYICLKISIQLDYLIPYNNELFVLRIVDWSYLFIEDYSWLLETI